MNNILSIYNDNTENIGLLNFSFETDDIFMKIDDKSINLKNIKIFFNNNISEKFFTELLKITIDAAKNEIYDDNKRRIKIITVNDTKVSIRLLYRTIEINYYNNNDQHVFSILIDYNIKNFIKELLEDYKIIAENGSLKLFVNEDSGYMQIINEYYCTLESIYDML